MVRKPIVAAVLIVIAPHTVSAQARDSSWTIRGGTYAGIAISIDENLATRRSSKFLRLSKLRNDPRFVSWNPSRLPAPVAFRPGRIKAEDSAAFWSTLREMEADMGMRLFEPATVGSNEDPDDVIIVDVKNMWNDEGVTYVTWSNNGGLYDARVFLRSGVTLHDPRTVAHEMMHALGFGHTSAWTSIMNTGSRAPRRLTAEDVAYVQFAFASRAASDMSDMWKRLALAVEREGEGAERVDGSASCTSDWPDQVIGLRQLVPAALPIAGPLRSSLCFR